MTPTETTPAYSAVVRARVAELRAGFIVATILLTSILHGAVHWAESYERPLATQAKPTQPTPADRLKTVYVEAQKRRSSELAHQFEQEHKWTLDRLAEKAQEGTRTFDYTLTICTQSGAIWGRKMVDRLEKDGFDASSWPENACAIKVNLAALEG